MELRNRSANSSVNWVSNRDGFSVCKNCMIIHLSNIYTLSRFFKYVFEKEQNLIDVLALISDRMTEEIALLSHSEL